MVCFSRVFRDVTVKIVQSQINVFYFGNQFRVKCFNPNRFRIRIHNTGPILSMACRMAWNAIFNTIFKSNQIKSIRIPRDAVNRCWFYTTEKRTNLQGIHASSYCRDHVYAYARCRPRPGKSRTFRYVFVERNTGRQTDRTTTRGEVLGFKPTMKFFF